MNSIDKQYQALLQDILDNGVKKGDRTGTGTISVFGRQIRHKMSEGFPLLTTKKMHWKSIATELLWFLRGETNISYLLEKDCHIWDGDAYKNFVTTVEKTRPEGYTREVLTQEEFIKCIKTDPEFAEMWGDLGPIYGKQWRAWNTYETVEKFKGYKHTEFIRKGKPIDQIADAIHKLKTNPDDRGIIVSAWNVGELDQMVLRPCHNFFQFYTRELNLEERMKLAGYEDVGGIGQNIIREQVELDNTIPRRAISLMFNMRSCDTFLGLPFNIASYALLLEIIAKEVNMIPDELIGNLGDTHLYSNHIEQAKEQIGRELTQRERLELLPNYNMDAVNEIRFSNFMDVATPEQIDRLLDTNNVPKKTREPYTLPQLKMNDGPPSIIEKPMYWKPEDFWVENYRSHTAIKAPLSN